MKKTILTIFTTISLCLSQGLMGSAIDAYSIAKAKDSIKINKIEQKLIKSLNNNPQSHIPGNVLISIWLMQERFDECHTLIDKLLNSVTTRKDSIMQLQAKAYTFMGQQKISTALPLFDSLELQEFTTSFRNQSKTLCFLSIDKIDSTIKYINTGIKNNDAGSDCFLGWMWYMLGDHNKSNSYYKRALQNKSPFSLTKPYYISHLIDIENFEDAYKYILDYKNDLTSMNYTTYCLFADYYLKKNELIKAGLALSKAKKIYPQNSKTKLLQISIPVQNGK